MRKIALFMLALGLMAYLTPQLRAQDTQVIYMEVMVDVSPRGDAAVKYKFKFNAQQFLNWEQRYGANPSLLKREMGKTLSQYETMDYKVEENKMEREATVSFKARGMVTYKGDGVFELRVPKDWKGGERDGNNIYRFNYIQPFGNGVMAQVNAKVQLPEKSSGFSEQLSEQGEKVIQYHLPAMSSGRGGWMIGALVIGVAGLLLIGAGIIMPNRAAA